LLHNDQPDIDTFILLKDTTVVTLGNKSDRFDTPFDTVSFEVLQSWLWDISPVTVHLLTKEDL
jgi:hypothetical protein